MASSADLILWRLCNPAYVPGLDGEGARLYGGRWNSVGRAAVYTASHLSLAVLEYFVHIPAEMRRAGAFPPLTAVRLAVPEAAVEDAENPKIDDSDWCRAHGDRWLAEGRSLALRVPSVVVPQEANVILNPAHPDFAAVRVAETARFRFDPRMGV